MKLIGNLKKQVDETTSKEEAKEVIEKAGMELTDEELDQVAGGINQNLVHDFKGNGVFTTDFNLVNPLAKK